MKRLVSLLAVAVMAASLLVSCHKDDEISVVDMTGVPATLDGKTLRTPYSFGNSEQYDTRFYIKFTTDQQCALYMHDTYIDSLNDPSYTMAYVNGDKCTLCYIGQYSYTIAHDTLPSGKITARGLITFDGLRGRGLCPGSKTMYFKTGTVSKTGVSVSVKTADSLTYSFVGAFLD